MLCYFRVGYVMLGSSFIYVFVAHLFIFLFYLRIYIFICCVLILLFIFLLNNEYVGFVWVMMLGQQLVYSLYFTYFLCAFVSISKLCSSVERLWETYRCTLKIGAGLW